MVGVSKTYPPQKQVLKNIYLSFFYGAKIGIIGLNGSGKSSLLKIIAGIDKSYQGEVVFSPGYTVGYLEQDPQLDPDKTVIEVVREGVQPIMDLLAEFDKVNESFGDPDVLDDPDKMDALLARQAELQDKLDAAVAWNMRWMRCSVRPTTRRFRHFPVASVAVWLCAVCCFSSLMCCYSTSLPTTWMPSQSIGWSSISSSIPAQ